MEAAGGIQRGLGPSHGTVMETNGATGSDLLEVPTIYTLW